MNLNNTHIIPFEIISLEPDNYHLIVEGKIDDQPILLILDTGASLSCFDMNFIENLLPNAEIKHYDGMNVSIASSNFESKLSILHNFQLGTLTFNDFPIVLIDFFHINEAYTQLGLSEIHGIIGSDFFVKYQAVIDFPKQQLQIIFSDNHEQ